MAKKGKDQFNNLNTTVIYTYEGGTGANGKMPSVSNGSANLWDTYYSTEIKGLLKGSGSSSQVYSIYYAGNQAIQGDDYLDNKVTAILSVGFDMGCYMHTDTGNGNDRLVLQINTNQEIIIRTNYATVDKEKISDSYSKIKAYSLGMNVHHYGYIPFVEYYQVNKSTVPASENWYEHGSITGIMLKKGHEYNTYDTLAPFKTKPYTFVNKNSSFKIDSLVAVKDSADKCLTLDDIKQIVDIK